MDFFEAVKKRRSVRNYSDEKVPEAIIHKALEAAILAPNSSNTQTWDFHWVKNQDKKIKLVEACLSQFAAKTASDLIVVTANSHLWKRSQKPLLDWAISTKAPKPVQDYYEKMIPLMYRYGFLNSIGYIKFLIIFFVGLFRPMPRGPNLKRDLQEVAIKSAALASENLMLAISAQNYDSCPMEGFDEIRVRRLLNLNRHYKVVMVIAIGKGTEQGTWGPQMRLPFNDVVHIY